MKISFRNRIICTPTINVLFADPNDIRERTQITKANPFEPPAEHHHITISISQLCVDDLGGGGEHLKRKKMYQYFTNTSQNAGSRTKAGTDPKWITKDGAARGLWQKYWHPSGTVGDINVEIISAMMNLFSISIFDPSPPLYVPHEIQ